MVSLQIQPPTSSTSFRREYSTRPSGYRTPSPPLHAVEPISPVPLHARLDDSTSWTSNKKRKVSDQRDLDLRGNFSLDGSNEAPLVGLGITNDRRPPRLQRPTTQHSSEAAPSPLDVFATVATSPSLDQSPYRRHQIPHPNGNTPQLSQQSNFSPNKHQPRSFERFSKRSRSEQIDFRSLPQSNTSRPATSYLAQAGWPSKPIEDRGVNGYHRQYDPAQANGAAHEASVFDAELLLSFARAAHHSPQQPQGAYMNETRPSGNQTQPPTYDHPSPTRSFHVNATAYYPPTSKQSAQFSVPTSLSLHKQWDPYKTHGNKPLDAHHTSQSSNAENGSGQPQTDVPPSKPRAHRGWPKGKPRGPRNPDAEPKRPTKGRGKRKVDKAESHMKRSGSVTSKGTASEFVAATQTQTDASSEDPFATVDKVSLKPRRNSILDFSRPKVSAEEVSDKETRSQRQSSAPPSISMMRNLPSTIKPAKKASPATPCPACSLIENSANGYNNSWIKCNGCNEWFHAVCAGFKSEREIRDIDKYFCKGCESQHGSTTFVRKSNRVHASVDYAGLNEGTIRTAIDVPEHHYIQPIKDGTLELQPETFPRMKPELVSSQYFERCGSFTEPILIPASWNPRPSIPGTNDGTSGKNSEDFFEHDSEDPPEYFSELYEYSCVPDEGQDKLGMVIPQGLTVRRCAELYGPDERVEVIDVKIQEGEDKRWNMRQWADYYEAEGEKPVRNVISLEVSQSKLGKLIKRPQVVRDLDLQDSVWPQEEINKGNYPKVQFYCLMSVADCYTDFHIDFGGSSVYYHILKGRKTFFFIPPKPKHLKKYEEWCQSSNQNNIFLGNETKECYRVDLYEGDTMLIPSGWIHAVWTPENSLVIGGNFLTRLHYGMQLQINEIEKNTGVARKFRYPHFQKVLWYTLLQYLEQDPLPSTVAQQLCEGRKFERQVPVHHLFEEDEHEERPEFFNARYYPESEIDGLHDLLRYIHRSVLVSLGKIPGVTKKTQEAVIKSLPKGYGDHLELAKTFAMWIAWKRGNEEIPAWAHPDAVPSDTEAEKKMSTAAMKQAERDAAYQAFKASGDRRFLRTSINDIDTSTGTAPANEPIPASVPVVSPVEPETKVEVPDSPQQPINNLKQSILGPKRVACEACRKKRIKCKHKPEDEPSGSFMEVVPQQFGIKQIRLVQPSFLNEDSEDVGTAAPPLLDGLRPPAQPNTDIGGSTFAGVIIDNSNVSSLSSDNSNSGKKSRTKACEDCRKSKRRCVHDERGRIDPVKASEPSIPRGPNPVKRPRTDSNSGPEDIKRVKSDPDVGDDYTTSRELGLLPDAPPALSSSGAMNALQEFLDANPLQGSEQPWTNTIENQIPDTNEPVMMNLPTETKSYQLQQSPETMLNAFTHPPPPAFTVPMPSVEPHDQQPQDDGSARQQPNDTRQSTPIKQPSISPISPGPAIGDSADGHLVTDVNGSGSSPTAVNTMSTEMADIKSSSPSAEVATSPKLTKAQATPKVNGNAAVQQTPNTASKHPSRERKQVERYSDTKQVETPKFNARAARQKSASSTPSNAKKSVESKPNSTTKRAPNSRSISREVTSGPTASKKSTSPASGGKLAGTSPAAVLASLSTSALPESPEDENMRLARELQEQEFGLRRRISR